MKIPFTGPREAVDPKAKAEGIIAAGEAKAAIREAKHSTKAKRKRTKAEIKAAERVEKEKARIEAGKRPFSVTPLVLGLIKGSAIATVVAAFAFIGVGLLFDVVFYAQQSSNPIIVAGLIVFAIALRITADFVPVVLQWAKPESEPGERRRVLDMLQFWKPPSDPAPAAPSTGVMAVLEKNQLARTSLRLLCVCAIIGSSFATVSFFSSGHETRTYAAESANTLETTKVQSKADRKADLEKQRTEAKKTRDSSVSAAKEAMQVIKDQVVGTSSADNTTLQKITDKIDTYNSDYTKKSNEIDAAINAINAEVENVEVAAAEDKATNAPFLGLYRFLARFVGDEESWTLGGAIFFSVIFELLCAFMLGALFVLLKAISFVARLMQAREKQQVLEWEFRLSKLESDARIENLKAEGLRVAQEAQLNLELAFDRAQQAERKAAAEQQIAEIERRILKANAQADAARNGAVYVDPDAELEMQAALKRAEAGERMAKIEAEIAAANKRAEEARNPTVPKPEPKPPLTPQQQAAENASKAAELAREAAKNVHKIPVGQWSNRADRVQQARAA